MLKILVKKQLTEIFRSYFYNPKTNKARSKGAVAGYIILFAVVMVGLLGGMFTMMSLGLCGPLVSAGMGWLYFALMSLLVALRDTWLELHSGDNEPVLKVILYKLCGEM